MLGFVDMSVGELTMEGGEVGMDLWGGGVVGWLICFIGVWWWSKWRVLIWDEVGC